MPLEQSVTSAFVRPRQDYQQAKKAEKVQTEQFYGIKRVTRTPSNGPELKDKRKDELNNNYENSNAHVNVNSGIPRRSFMKTPEADNPSKQRDFVRKENAEKNSPKPRRKLPAAPVGSSMKPRLPGNETVSRRSTPENPRRSTPERQFEKSRTTPERVGQHEKNAPTFDNMHKSSEIARRTADGSRKTPEINKKGGEISRRTPENMNKPQEIVVRKNSDSSDKNSRIKKPMDGSMTLPKKLAEPNDSSKSKGILGGIKYNSLPRRHPSKNHSKFYLDIEGEEYMPKKTDDDKFLNNEQNDKSPIEYGLEKLALLAKSGKNFTNGLKNNSYEPPVLEIGSQDLKQTHVALYKFLPRHKDEIVLDEGDPIHVSKIGDDLWHEGTNLMSGKSGVFPSRYVADILAGPNSLSGINAEDQQFFLRFLGSVEVADYKGDEILCYAISKIVNQRAMLSSNTPPACTLQVSSRGIRVCDFDEKQLPKSSPKAAKKNKGKDKEKEKLKEQRETMPTPTHFFSLKNVTFCGNHPRDRRYFGFITKHPDEHRFACHVFMSKYSTDPVAQAVGDCFKKFYNQYLDYRAPTEDIYME